MITRDERLRAIRWGGELLERIASDMSLPSAIADEAARIGVRYPSAAALEELSGRGNFDLPTEWRSTLYDAFILLFELAVIPRGSEDTPLRLRYTKRHFPNMWCMRALSAQPLDFKSLMLAPSV